MNREDEGACLCILRKGDTLVICRVDRFGRLLKVIVTIVNEF